MIPVTRADEPADFDTKVRRPGLRALANRLDTETRGRGRPPQTYARTEDIPAGKIPPLWRRSLGDLMSAYQQICAYTGLYLEEGTGDATVDHWIPVATDRHKAYEWSNYRLACGSVNTAKGTHQVLDPFTIEDGWFELELVGYQVLPGALTVDPLRASIRATIDILGLNSASLRRQRSRTADSYLHDGLPLRLLERRAPFIARELRRQGKLRAEDLPVS